KYIGNFRDYNISKSEPVLNGATVAYTNHLLIKDTLEYDFNEEKNYNYSNKSHDEIISHIATFTSNIWQVHPFGEGNTRTTALFIQKYIQYLGLGDMNNEIFKDNSRYFRNALVRANFRDISKGIYEDDNFLYKFFSNLLLETNYELNDQDLYVAKEEEKNFDDIENDVEL
ncbi:Fic family protein, partial [Thomasclavelia cocleata]